jgi:uncharacterized membrane protein HdeD (DUF308 family)
LRERESVAALALEFTILTAARTSEYLWANLPVTAIWLLGVLLGIQLVCEGAALGYLAWKVRTG